MYKCCATSRFQNIEPVIPGDFSRKSSENFILPKIPFGNIDNQTGDVTLKEIKELMEFNGTSEELQSISERCSFKRLHGLKYENHYLEKGDLTESNYKYIFKSKEFQSESLKFKTIQKSKEIRSEEKFSYQTWLKYKSDRCPDEKVVSIINPPDLQPGTELMIRIRVYHPFKHFHGIKPTGCPKFHQEIIVLGSQTLDCFVDNIICANVTLCVDKSENIEADNGPVIKNMIKSGFLFINETFYNDFRDKNNIDYSECIRKWAQNRPRTGLGPFETSQMESTTFNQLKINLGYPHVYQHLGNCEHLFTFSDVEILQPSDSCYSVSYPIRKSISLRKARYCSMCGMYVAKWRVEGCERIPFDTSFLCQFCFQSYNYIDGKKIGNFKAYPYVDSVNALLR